MEIENASDKLRALLTGLEVENVPLFLEKCDVADCFEMGKVITKASKDAYNLLEKLNPGFPGQHTSTF